MGTRGIASARSASYKYWTPPPYAFASALCSISPNTTNPLNYLPLSYVQMSYDDDTGYRAYPGIGNRPLQRLSHRRLIPNGDVPVLQPPSVGRGRQSVQQGSANNQSGRGKRSKSSRSSRKKGKQADGAVGAPRLPVPREPSASEPPLEPRIPDQAHQIMKNIDARLTYLETCDPPLYMSASELDHMRRTLQGSCASFLYQDHIKRAVELYKWSKESANKRIEKHLEGPRQYQRDAFWASVQQARDYGYLSQQVTPGELLQEYDEKLRRQRRSKSATPGRFGGN
jgi:hypothetical protein